MKKRFVNVGRKTFLFALGLSVTFRLLSMQVIVDTGRNGREVSAQTSQIASIRRINPTTVEILFPNSQRMTLDFYGENIFRVFQDNSGSVIRDPQAKPGGADISRQSQKGGFKAEFGREYRFCFPHYRKDKSPAG